jgi:ribosome-associated protein
MAGPVNLEPYTIEEERRRRFADRRIPSSLGRDVMAEIDTSTNPTDPSVAAVPAVDPAATSPRRRRARREEDAQDDVPHTAVARSSPDRTARAVEIVKVCARIADDNRGKDIVFLDLRKATSLVDFFLIITASSRRMSHAIAEEIDAEMKRRGELKLGMEGSEEGRWVLIDYGDFVVHVFSGDARTYYSLEEIWGDAETIPWQDEPKPKA